MGTSKFQRPTLALAPILLLACGGGVAAPAPEGFGWQSPLNAFEPSSPAGDESPSAYEPGSNPYQPGLNGYQNPTKPSKPPVEQTGDKDSGFTKFDAGLKDVQTQIDEGTEDSTVTDAKKDSSGGGCFSPCSGSLTCTPESGGSSTTADLAPNGADCDLSVGSTTVTLVCGGAAQISTTTGTWTDTAGSLKLCFSSGGSSQCTICN